MNKIIKLIARIPAFALAAIALIFQILMIIAPTPGTLGGYLVVAYVTLGIAVVMALSFSTFHLIISIIANPKRGVKIVIIIAVALLSIFIAHMLSSNDSPRIIGTLLYLTYIVLGYAALSAVWCVFGSLISTLLFPNKNLTKKRT